MRIRNEQMCVALTTHSFISPSSVPGVGVGTGNKDERVGPKGICHSLMMERRKPEHVTPTYASLTRKEIFLIEAWLIYNVELVSAIQTSDSVIYIYILYIYKTPSAFTSCFFLLFLKSIYLLGYVRS